jgi:hypothetical protein
MSEALKLREAVSTAEMFWDRKLSTGEILMIERRVKDGITIEDLMRIIDAPVEGPEPDPDATHRYERQGNTAAKIPEVAE